MPQHSSKNDDIFEKYAKKSIVPGPPRPCYDACFIGNCFCCDHCVWAPQNRSVFTPKKQIIAKTFGSQLKSNLYFYLTIIVLIGLDAWFIYFDGMFLITNIHFSVVFISQIIVALVLIMLITTACTDPGILLPSTEEEAILFERNDEIPPIVPGQPIPNITKDIIIYEQPIKLKWCYTCRFYRPPRAIHCSTCNVCVDTFDHHCPWIGNCVGRRNYRCFFLFINSLSLLGIYVGACVLTHLVLETRNSTLGNAIKRAPFSVVGLFVILIANWSIFGLAGLHVFLTMSSLTTNEDIKGTYVSRVIPHNENSNAPRYMENPFSTGSPYKNIRQVLCHSRISTKLHQVI